MTYKVALHPSIRKTLQNLYRFDRPGYDYLKHRLRLLAYRPEMGVPLKPILKINGEFISGLLCWSILLTLTQISLPC